MCVPVIVLGMEADGQSGQYRGVSTAEARRNLVAVATRCVLLFVVAPSAESQ